MTTDTTASAKRRRSPLQPERAATEYAILGCLLLHGPGHGYDLTRQFAPGSELGIVCQLEMSMLYALLKKLEREGLISGRDEQVSERKSRRIVELTEQGQAEIEDWLLHPVHNTREIRLDFMVKLYFARQLKPTQAQQLLDEQLAFHQKNLEQLIAQKEATPPDSDFVSWVLDFRVEQNASVLKWLNRCRQQLKV